MRAVGSVFSMASFNVRILLPISALIVRLQDEGPLEDQDEDYVDPDDDKVLDPDRGSLRAPVASLPDMTSAGTRTCPGFSSHLLCLWVWGYCQFKH